MRSRSLVSVLALAIAAVGALTGADTYAIDPVHSSVVFKISHLGIGTFWGRAVGETDKMGTVTVDAADPAKNTITVTVPVSGIDTHNEKRDKHLQGPDFFDGKQFPELTFTSTSWTARSDGAADVAGNLTIHGVTKPVTISVKKVGEGKDPWGGTRVGYDGQFTVKRSDFGMTTMLENGAVGNEVTVFLGIEAVKK